MHDPNPNKVFADNSCAQAWKPPFMASGHVVNQSSFSLFSLPADMSVNQSY